MNMSSDPNPKKNSSRYVGSSLPRTTKRYISMAHTIYPSSYSTRLKAIVRLPMKVDCAITFHTTGGI